MKVIYTDKDENAKHFIYRWERLHIEGLILPTATHANVTLNVTRDKWKLAKYKEAITFGVETIIQISQWWNLKIGDLSKK